MLFISFLTATRTMTYLVVNDAEDRGVYEFQSRSVAEDIAYNFKNYVFMHEDEVEKAKALAGVTEVTDAVFLIRKYRAKGKAAPKKEVVPAASKPATKESTKNSDHEFVKLFNKIKECGNTIKISMVNGDDYIISMKSYFLKASGNDCANMITLSNGEVCVNEPVIDDAVKRGIISVLPKTKIEYLDNYMILSGCDDNYSPNPVGDSTNVYAHQYEKVAINMNNIASVSVIKDFDFGSNEVLKADVIVKYLVRKML